MDYRIAGHNIRISFEGEENRLRRMLHSYEPFRTDGCEDSELLFHIRIEKELKEVEEEERRLIRDVDTGNGMTRVDKKKDGGYQFLVRDIYGKNCGLLITSPRFTDCQCALRGSEAAQRFALNNILMLTFAFSSTYYDTLLIHASVIRHAGRAYAFTAKSGTGKSTQVANWMRYIEGCDIMNDDNPIIRLIDGKPVLFGSPWSGKTPCYRNIKAELGAVVLIERDDHNHVEEMHPIKRFATLLTACSAMKWDEELYQRVCTTVTGFVESTRIVTLHCLPDADSAITCRKYLEDNGDSIE